MKRILLHGYFTLFALGSFAAQALDNSPPAMRLEPYPASAFQQGEWELNLNGGALFSPFVDPARRHTVNYSYTAFQAGYMLNSPPSTGWLRGNFELLGEAFGGKIFQGQGEYLAGATAWLRYNIVPPDSRFVPYAQLGAGVLWTDVDRRIESEDFNLNGDIGVGCRYFLSPKCSVNLEFRYQHISNGGLSKTNVGINAAGPIFGISWFF
jgi:opacity protein-like surface antigen